MKSNGFTIVEIMVVVGVIIIAFTAVLGFFAFEAKIAERSRMRLQAISLIEESMEAVRNFRDNTTWDSGGIGDSTVITMGADYYPVSSSTGWDIVSGNEIVNVFTRAIVFNQVSRDEDDDISGSGTNDPNTRKITVIIVWTDRQGSATESLITYITNWRQ